MEITPNGGNMENVIEMKNKKKTVEVKPMDREVIITRKVLRSGSVERDTENSDKHHGKGGRKGDLCKDMISSVDEVKEEGKREHVESPVPEETHGDGFRSRVKVEDEDDVSGKEVPVKRQRGTPHKLQISSQSDGNEKKLIGVSFVQEEEAKVKLESEQSAEDKMILGADFRSQVKVEIKDDTSYGEDGNVEPHDEEVKVKRKRGRPKKFQASSQSDESGSSTNCKLARSPDMSSVSLKPQRKRGRPPAPKTKRKSGDAGRSDCEAKKRLKVCESLYNPLIDGEKRIGEVQNKQIEAGEQSKSKSKKMLSDRILQLLLAAGWKVEYRPRYGRLYNDAVYVNPEGKTHWSVTKAYQVYKNHLERSMNDQTNSTTGSGFGLLSEDDLHLLVRKIQKKRSDKGKQRQNWKDIDTNDKMVSAKGIGKRALHGKEGQKKRKGSDRSHSLERISVSKRKIKREEKHNRKRGALSARSSLSDADSKENGYILFEGKRTMLGWMIDSAVVPLYGKVQCMNCKKTQAHLEGMITKEGIRCNCCDEVFSVFDFEVHAGGKHNQPFRSLYLEGGRSLLECYLESWNKQSETVLKGFHTVDFGVGDQNDDTCAICGDGGDLICCDGCPSTFHQSCLGIKKFPSGAWFCCYCSCKFCEKVEAANHDTTTLSTLLRCRQCEEKYHQTCIKQESMVPGEISAHSFCGKYCQELSEGLQLLIGVKHPLPEGFSWTFLRRFELPREVLDSDISEKIAYNAKLAVAFSVMDECFSPLVDHRSGVNLLENIVYNFGSNIHRLNYSNFRTAVLERGDEIIGVASIRIHGNQLAEMPFIGTRYMYRRQGMCRRLMNGIETALGSLKVDKLVIPAVPELMDTWTSGFGFRPVDELEKKTIKNLNLVVFPGVDMLEKPLVKESNVSSSNGDLPLAPAMSVPVDVEETKLCVKSMDVDEADNNVAESNPKLLNVSLEEKDEIGKLTDKDESLPDVVDNQRESNLGVADDSHADQTGTKRQESGDLEDKTPSGVNAEVAEESDDCYIIEQPQRLGNGGTEKKIDNKTLALKKQVPSKLRASPRLNQRSWRTSTRVKQKYTGRTNGVLLNSSQQYV
ncbi:unnamed protein product [Thlaspi arvense]|uniref:PHD-type domain-containing protein n=1 Tax=Thlaspi arvense TaxID=13288 RepID=A0AAU9TAK1_THLAR|nr:unnamed protein product [Thlaspi arvense]